ncbi:VTT domain-containing protein [Candidatus Woesearchaeota archaeon]|nr:VTT domain-containing protein [Candidatus Woesearchaeota archaeon]
MRKKTEEFGESKIFKYNRFYKTSFGAGVIIAGSFLVLLIISFLFLKDSNLWLFKNLNLLITHFTKHIAGASLLGALYTTMIGGLFFLSVPIELLFIKFFNSGKPVMIILLFYFIGLFISYSINYFIGLKLSGVSKKLISPKKFYKLKGILNKYGALAVFVFNAVPLPSQIFAAILGVFRYNKTRFYVFFLLGQLTKYIGMIIILSFF